MASENIYGTASDQYKRVWDYAAAFVKHNPGSSANVVVSSDENPPHKFLRMYICPQACKEGFVAGCRPILSLDGCRLTGTHSGQLLTAVGKDGNANIYPVAWAIVEMENVETWTWFLELLVKDLGSTSVSEKEDRVAFMSHGQKGLLEAFAAVVPQAEVRFCCRHIWANFEVKFRGLAYKQLFWNAARAYCKADFNKHMEAMKMLSKDAHEYLASIPTKHWCRHAFSTQAKSAMLLNNCCESFKRVLKKAREMPILSLMEWIREYVMTRMYYRREGIRTLEGGLTPSAMKQLEIAKNEYKHISVIQAGPDEFEVDHGERTFVVNLKENTCGCFQWELTGIPCTHAFHCITKKKLDPKTFVHKAYTKDAYKKAYEPILYPMPGIKHWEKTTYPEPDPPAYRNMSSRPTKKKRRKEPVGEAERRVKRTKKANNCGNCGQPGHYKTTCTNPPKPKGKSGAGAETAEASGSSTGDGSSVEENADTAADVSENADAGANQGRPSLNQDQAATTNFEVMVNAQSQPRPFSQSSEDIQ